MLTLLLTPRATDETERMAAAAHGRGLLVVQPATWALPALDASRVLIYGGELFVAFACQELGLPLPIVDPSWLPSLPIELTRRRIEATNLGRVRGRAGPLFVKPVQEKTFAAAVYSSGAALPALPDDEPVYVSEPVRFLREYRCFLDRGTCRTGSLYAVDGRPVAVGAADAGFADAGFADAARVAEAAWSALPTLPEAVVIDVGLLAEWEFAEGELAEWEFAEGELAEGELAVVEPNSIAESALYGADPDVVLELIASLFGHDLGSGR
ncbi:MAG: ATP-grasp domain-containing protein [Pseudomonadota bacterium]|nr:ATP-grasp domain-containing protein [Pseudomonadota bacterium]